MLSKQQNSSLPTKNPHTITSITHITSTVTTKFRIQYYSGCNIMYTTTYIVYCILYIVHYISHIIHNVYTIPYIMHYTLYIIYITCIIQCNNIYNTLYIIQYHSGRSTMGTIAHIVYNVSYNTIYYIQYIYIT